MSATASPRPHTRWRFAVLFGIAGALIVGIVVLAFVWPAATAKARDLPVGIAGPPAQVDQLESALAKQSTRPFDLVAVDSRADAVRAIRERRLYGAVLLGDSPEVLTSSAASTVSNQALRGVAATLQARVAAGVEQGLAGKLEQSGAAIGGLQKQVAGLQKQIAGLQRALSTGNRSDLPAGGTPSTSAGGASSAPASGAPSTSAGGAPSTPAGGAASAATPPTVRVTDVVALASTDPTGSGLAAAGFPLVLGGMLGGVLVSLLVVGVVRRVVALLVYGAAAGTVVVLVLQTWLEVLQRDFLLNTAAFGLAMAATAALVVGFNSLLGQPGIAIGAIISLLVGNPISGATLPYQFIAGPWGEVGQYFVPGAASSLIRSLSYFPDADTGAQWLTLGAWTLGGLLLTVVGHFRSAAPIPLPARELQPATA